MSFSIKRNFSCQRGRKGGREREVEEGYQACHNLNTDLPILLQKAPIFINKTVTSNTNKILQSETIQIQKLLGTILNKFVENEVLKIFKLV